MSWVLVSVGAGMAARTTGQFMSYMVLGLAFGAAQVIVLGLPGHREPLVLCSGCSGWR